MKRRRIVIGLLLLIIGLPIVLVLAAAALFYTLNRTNGTVSSSGVRREYLLHVPQSYDRTRPVPLVISLHALAMWSAAQMETSGWNRLADEHGFIVVYPSGTGVAPKMWRMRPETALMADVQFISDLIDRLEATYNIDRRRIYVNGFSNGGGASFVLSCRLSNRVAAIGAVAAAQVLPWRWCTDHREVPMIAFHGTADRIVPYEGGPSAFFDIPFPRVPDWVANWAERNKCEATPLESRIAAQVTRIRYTRCAEGADVVLYTIEGGGHSWPGGRAMPEWLVGPTSREIDATATMWAFFSVHRLPGTGARDALN